MQCWTRMKVSVWSKRFLVPSVFFTAAVSTFFVELQLKFHWSLCVLWAKCERLYAHTYLCISLCLCPNVSLCPCGNEQHLQEGRKAQQYLDQCWKQMDNVSGKEEGKGRTKEKHKCLVYIISFRDGVCLIHVCMRNERNANKGNSSTFFVPPWIPLWPKAQIWDFQWVYIFKYVDLSCIC